MDLASELTRVERLAVRAYRTGLVTMTFGLATLAVECLVVGPRLGVGVVLIGLGCQFSIWTLHVYDPGFRRIFRNVAVLSGVGLVSGAVLGAELLVWVGLGFAFAGLGALGLKERTCFQVRGTRVLPTVLATAWMTLVLGWSTVAAMLLLLATVLATWLVEVKLGQPLHLDIGDRALYR